MLRERVIPVLLLQRGGVVKTTRFEKPVYVGDPINAVKIFNEKEVDELFLLDIDASKEHRGPDFRMVEAIVSEAFMPVAYGGGVRSLADAKRLLASGVEKIALSTGAMRDLRLVTELKDHFGAQCVVGVVDVKRRFGRARVFTRGPVRPPESDPLTWARALERAGAGEIFLQSVDRDGTMSGFDLELLRSFKGQLGVPLVACGGASELPTLLTALGAGGASAIAAGARFVFIGPHRAVLISYLTEPERQALRATTLSHRDAARPDQEQRRTAK